MDNDQRAEQLKQDMKKQKTLLINLMSSPGSGKTSTLKALISKLKDKIKIGVMEADIDSDVDAQAIVQTGVRTIQAHTGGLCYLDADMTKDALSQMNTSGLDLVVLENVGNLVCPAEVDTGANMNMMILSVPEGDDKPLKYPLMFSECDILIINKIDTLGFFDFNLKAVEKRAKKLKPDVVIFPISAKTGEGVDALADYIFKKVIDFKK
jgi:hydrogenase nickel incorporation protein HypB